MELTEFVRKHAQKHVLSTFLLREVELAFKQSVPEIQCAQVTRLLDFISHVFRRSICSEIFWQFTNPMPDISLLNASRE